jgi:guanine deaminase
MNVMKKSFILKGDICYSKSIDSLAVMENGYAVCVDGLSAGVFPHIPGEYSALPVMDFSGALITPGLTDLHIHAPQYGFRALGMDMELLDWLENRAFPEEAKFADLEYGRASYSMLIQDLLKGPNTRFCFFGTLHVPATLLLMRLLDESGLVSYAGKVNMDRNCPETLREQSAEDSAAATSDWIEQCRSLKNCKPILTPRFIPACSDRLMGLLSEVRQHYRLPVQSHLSENRKEIEWVKELAPRSSCYLDAYSAYNMAGKNGKTIMAHCVWSGEEEVRLLKEGGVYVAHCPQSNTNLASGIAPVRTFLDRGVPVGLGSDIAGGASSSIFRAMADAISVSKLRNCLVDSSLRPLTVEEAFYLGTAGGGSFFGKAGSFEKGYEFDALVLNDSEYSAPFPLTVKERLERTVYLSEDRHIAAKYIRGVLVCKHGRILKPRSISVR